MKRDFDLLNLKPGSTLEEIKRAYKTEAKKWHPDRFPTQNKEQQEKVSRIFQEITEAFNRLKAWHENRAKGQYAFSQPEPQDISRNKGAENGSWEDETFPNLPQFITRSWPNGDRYEGMAVNDMMHGRGLFTYADGSVYSGQFQYGKMEGQGKLDFSNGDTYTGGFLNNRFHGQGTLQFSNGDRYMGAFLQDQYHGQGVFIADGKVYAGQWEYGSLKTHSGGY